LQGLLLQVYVAEIVLHEADDPDALVVLLDTDPLTVRLQEAPPQVSPHLEQPPAIDAAERFLVALFLRRYVTYSTRRRHLAQMQRAAALHGDIVTDRSVE
jgi:hypothetical protein